MLVGAAGARSLDEHHPFATIIACSDSRVPVELLFDQGIGDLFVIRVAGNVVGEDETGSIDYAVEHLECPLIVVLGHRKCGAVTAAVEHVKDSPSIMALVDHIEPAVTKVLNRHPELSGEQLVEATVEENVWHSVEDLTQRSEITRERIASGKLTVVGAVYDIATGRVRWLGHHPNEYRLAHD
jgi:carbonic anhydrase